MEPSVSLLFGDVIVISSKLNSVSSTSSGLCAISSKLAMTAEKKAKTTARAEAKVGENGWGSFPEECLGAFGMFEEC